MPVEPELRDGVVKLLQRLCPAWRTLLLEAIGLDATLPASSLLTALAGTVPINRLYPGFHDFAPRSDRLICRGDPAQSALYHAFASPNVRPEPPVAFWPTAEDLDLLENWIYAHEPLSLADLPHGSFVGVFAYEYRPAASTPHQRQADFVYSRTGIARVGECGAVWDGPNRCWSGRGTGGRLAVMPARYAAFIAVDRRIASSDVSVLGGKQDGDERRLFALPVRKLIPGEMLDGTALALRFKEFHRREKLQRLFLHGGYAHPSQVNSWPYVRDSANPGQGAATGAATKAEPLVDMVPIGASVSVSPPPGPLVREARLPDGNIALLPHVPPRSFLHVHDFAWNRSASSLRINTGLLTTIEDAVLNEVLDKRINLRPRNAPEFANIRHEVRNGAIVDLSAVLGDDFRETVNDGGYAAALYEDSVCDGVVACLAPALSRLEFRAAFSVVTAPDFFPFVDEVEIQEWVDEHEDHNVRHQFRRGGPSPLCVGRLPPNQTLPNASGGGRAFTPTEETAVAIVARPYNATHGATQKRPSHGTTTFLSDGASNVFAPGWDVTMSEQDGVSFYSTFGLGAPFPEDMKLCAAANGFWPAAAPDAARTFQKGPTAIPLLDEELGWHPANPRKPVCVTSGPGWDGETGPFIVEPDAVNFCDFWRSDYVSNAIAGNFGKDMLSALTTDEVIARMDALRVCIQWLANGSDPAGTRLWLVHAERASVPAIPGLVPLSIGYRYELVLPRGDDMPDPTDKRRRIQRFDPKQRYECLVSARAIHWRVPPVAIWERRLVPAT